MDIFDHMNDWVFKLLDTFRLSDLKSGVSIHNKKWEQAAKAEMPIRFMIWKIAFGFVEFLETCFKDMPYNTYCWITNSWTNQHVLKSKSLYRGNWYEYDNKMLYCCFDELIDFVEIECASIMNGVGWMAGYEYLKREEDYETMALYKWWKHDRPARVNPCDMYLNDESITPEQESVKTDDYINLLQAQEDEDTEMLVRLVRHRHKIWT